MGYPQMQWCMSLYTIVSITLIRTTDPEKPLTIIQACFANDEKLCVDPVGKKAGHETEENSHNRVAFVASVLRFDKVGLQPCWGW